MNLSKIKFVCVFFFCLWRFYRILRENNIHGRDSRQSLRVREGSRAAYGALSARSSHSLESRVRGWKGKRFNRLHDYYGMFCDIINCVIDFQSSRYGRENRGQLMTSVSAPILDRRNYTVYKYICMYTQSNTHTHTCTFACVLFYISRKIIDILFLIMH